MLLPGYYIILFPSEVKITCHTSEIVLDNQAITSEIVLDIRITGKITNLVCYCLVTTLYYFQVKSKLDATLTGKITNLHE
jgi:hypothetical protein